MRGFNALYTYVHNRSLLHSFYYKYYNYYITNWLFWFVWEATWWVERKREINLFINIYINLYINIYIYI